MKIIKCLAVITVLTVLISSVPFLAILSPAAAASENLGTVTECVIDRSSQTVSVKGSIKHSVLVNNRDSKLAVYRFDSWDNISSELKVSEPLETMDMTIRFEFDLPCQTIAQRLSLYAVAIISPAGEVRLVSEPQYADYSVSDTSNTGFKAVVTDDVAAAVAAHPGSAVIDIYLDKLDRGNKSGHIFNADGDLLYFDREVIDDLDKKVMAYTASNANVYFRFLISGDSNELPFCTKGNIWATNKCVVINNIQALHSIYAYTYFLISRYDGEDFGRVDGIILGKGCDMPVLYNYASLVSESYETVYARSLVIIGLAAAEAAGNSNISLIVPVGDSLTDNGKVYASSFLESIATYLDNYSKISYTVMCESRHNPYKLNDSYFSTEIDPEETGEEDYISPIETMFQAEYVETEDFNIENDTVSDESLFPDEETHDSTVTDAEYDVPETTQLIDDSSQPVEKEPLVQNTDSDGFFCTDNINTFLRYFNSLKKKYNSVNTGFSWCWYPDSDTLEGALGVCYAYNYMKLATVGADFFAICFENDVYDAFSSISHLFKYIDTNKNHKETSYARSIFEIDDWSEIIDGYTSATGVFHQLYEKALEPNVADYIGEIVYFDYSSGRGTGGWVDGLFCDSLGMQIEGTESFLQANMDLDSAGVNQSEIVYVFDSPEPLLMGDALTFEIKCGEYDGSLYEVAILICSKNSTIESKAVIVGGVKSALSLNVSDHDNRDGVDSIKITLKRVTGSGKCKINLYRVLINSVSESNEQLEKEFKNIREYLRADSLSKDNDQNNSLGVGVLALSFVGVAAFLVAFLNDKRTNSTENNESNNR